MIGSRLGMADDPRLQTLASALLEWQWPDGGWNCHRNASGRRSTFHESLTAAWGLQEFAVATGDKTFEAAAGRAADLFLARLGKIADRRARQGLDHLQAKQRDDGLWTADRQWWKPADSRFKHQHEVIAWGLPGQPSEMITLNALRILKAANRLDVERAAW